MRTVVGSTGVRIPPRALKGLLTMTLLTRDPFRESVFNRDNNLCVVCVEVGVDAHHIKEVS